MSWQGYYMLIGKKAKQETMLMAANCSEQKCNKMPLLMDVQEWKQTDELPLPRKYTFQNHNRVEPALKIISNQPLRE